METIYEVYTDGACTNNQASGGQPGGWGAVFLDGRKFSGGDMATTNNRMEMTAAIEALKNTPTGSNVKIYSDSAYVINAFKQNWLSNWVKRGWKTSQGKPVENQDLWKELQKFEQERNVTWVKVKGHSGDKWNEVADQLAVNAIPKKGQTPKKTTQQPESTTIDTNNEVNLQLTEANYTLLLKIISKLAEKDDHFVELYQAIKAKQIQ